MTAILHHHPGAENTSTGRTGTNIYPISSADAQKKLNREDGKCLASNFGVRNLILYCLMIFKGAMLSYATKILLFEINSVAACKRTQQLPTLLHQQYWELLRTCWQWWCKRMQQLPTMGRIQPISLCKLCVMSVRGPSNVGRAVQTNPTLLFYASAITEQKKCWELLAEKFDWFQTLRNNTQKHATGCANGPNM